MGRYMNKCKGLAEIAVEEFAGGVRNRDNTELGKRIREDGDAELDLASAYVELRSTRRRVLVEASSSVSLTDDSAPPLSSVDNHEGTISDPEGKPKSCRLETTTCSGGRESSSSASQEEQSAIVDEMPSGSEIDDFFTAAEQDLQKRFSDKYNFDTSKGVPLEGRYEWVRVHHA